MPLQPDGDRKQQLRFAAERKGRACPRYVCADEETFVCVDQPSRHNDVSWIDPASAIKASPTVVRSVFVNAGSLSMRPFLPRTNRPSAFFGDPLLHKSMPQFSSSICCRQRNIGSEAGNGTMCRTVTGSPLLKRDRTICTPHVSEYSTPAPRQESLHQPKTLDD